MFETTFPESEFGFQVDPSAPRAAVNAQPCGECVGSGGWYRYEPAMDPAPGLLYLSCLQCRGSGRTAPASA